MLMNEANPMWVARQLGHANMKITLEVYSKWIDLADKSRELDKVNNALFAPTLPQEKASTAES
jgi:integrase